MTGICKKPSHKLRFGMLRALVKGIGGVAVFHPNIAGDSVEFLREFQRGFAADSLEWALSPMQRVLIAGRAVCFYAAKLLVPVKLTFIYPKWNVDASSWIFYMPGMILVGCFSVFWWKHKTWGRPLLFGLGYFVVALFPVLGLFDQTFYRYSLVADHWQYIAIVAPIALVVAAGVAASSRYGERGKYVGVLVSVAGLVVLGMATWTRAGVYENSGTLWLDTVAKNPNAWVAHYNLGNALLQAGRVEDATKLLDDSIQVFAKIKERS